MKEQLEISIRYLASEEAIQSVQREAYWPKWNSPWWHMLLLYELGEAKRIPKIIVHAMVEKHKGLFPIFPIYESDFPKDFNPYRDASCLCALGSMYQILFACGVDVANEIPWMREWLFNYQMPDGGYNCDEKSYLKPNPKGSIVSTLPCLEALLFCRSAELIPEEIKILNRGAEYLVRQKLFRRVSTGEVIDQDWLEIRFPRFYEYDFFRGYYFLVKWREISGFVIPEELEIEARALVEKQLQNNQIVLKRYNLFDKRSYNPQVDGSWVWGEASEFGLMKAVSAAGVVCEPLTKKWHEIVGLTCGKHCE